MNLLNTGRDSLPKLSLNPQKTKSHPFYEARGVTPELSPSKWPKYVQIFTFTPLDSLPKM